MNLPGQMPAPDGSRGRLQVVQEFVGASAKATSMAELKDLIADASVELGFDYYAIVHHVRFGHPSPGYVRLTNYPIEWLAILREQKKLADPVLRAAERAASGFKWERLDSILSLRPAERAHLGRAARYRMVRGFTVPNHVPGEIFGSCNFVVRPEREFPDASTSAAQALGSFAFEAARRLVREKDEPLDSYVDPAPLSERQRECLLFVAKGKSDSVIAQLLDIKPRTVNEHIEAAKRRYAVASRSQLLVRALFRSEICFSEVLD